MKNIKFAIALVFVAAVVASLAVESFGYPPFLAKSRKFGAKDCTFCHIAPEGGPPWNERGQWLISEKQRRGADAVDVEWLADYKPGNKVEDKKPAPRPAPSSAAGAVEQELLKLEREWLDAYVKRDAAAMDRIEADDFMITYPDGKVVTKSEEIANIKRPAPDGPAPTFTTEETKVRVYGDTAILTGKVIQKGTYAGGPNKGQEYNIQSRYTDVYVKRNGRWQVVASHLTGIAGPPSQPAPSSSASSAPAGGKVDPKVFDAYVGQYDAPFGVITVTKEGDKLFGEPSGQSKEELVPESDTVFNVTNVGAKVTFVKDASGKVTHAIINLQGQDVQAKKIK
ncbi:MAG TPA: DUF4440 domain-containing protein [Blastocatellia bacterium]|nr:DUF4440 domain-containing protein [Blastocatellia bacterium]